MSSSPTMSLTWLACRRTQELVSLSPPWRRKVEVNQQARSPGSRNNRHCRRSRYHRALLLSFLNPWWEIQLLMQVRKEKLGDRVTALQQLVSPFGKVKRSSFSESSFPFGDLSLCNIAAILCYRPTLHRYFTRRSNTSSSFTIKSV